MTGFRGTAGYHLL